MEDKITWKETTTEEGVFCSCQHKKYECNISPTGYEIFYYKEDDGLYCVRGFLHPERYKEICEDIILNDKMNNSTS